MKVRISVYDTFPHKLLRWKFIKENKKLKKRKHASTKKSAEKKSDVPEDPTNGWLEDPGPYQGTNGTGKREDKL